MWALVTPHGLSLGKRSHGIAAPCPAGTPHCGQQSGGLCRSQSRSHPAHRGRAVKAYVRTWCLEEVPRFGAQHPPRHGVPSPHRLLHSCPSSCCLRTARRPTSFIRSALTCCVTGGKCPASSGPQPSDLCNGAGEHRLFSGSFPGGLFCHPVSWPRSGGDLGCGGPGLSLSHTYGAGLVPKEVDGVEAVLVQAVQAVALVPALREDVKTDHASCGGGSEGGRRG